MAKTRAEIQRAYRERKSKGDMAMRIITLILPMDLIDRAELAFSGDGISEKVAGAIRAGLEWAPGQCDRLAWHIVDVCKKIGPTGQFGGKYFISYVHESLAVLPEYKGMTLPELSEILIQANRAGLLRLSRADMVDAMDPALVAASEIRDGLATFHFVEIHNKLPPSLDLDKLATANAKNAELEKKIAMLEAKLNTEKGLPAGVTVGRLATAACDVCRNAKKGRYKGDSVYIAVVYEGLIAFHPYEKLPRAVFDWALLEAYRAGLLKLTRKDLRGAKKGLGVRSEITDGKDMFHLVEP